MTCTELSALQADTRMLHVSYLVEVCLHELKDHKNILELTRVRRQQDVLNLHDIWVLELAQQLDLAKDASGVLQQSSDEL